MIECTFKLNSKSMSDFKIGAATFPAFSGYGQNVNRPDSACVVDFGPIPPGAYYIFDRESGGILSALRERWNHKSEWFALHAIDQKIDDEMICDQVKRGAFRLHPKGTAGISRGCITIDRLMAFQFISSVLRSGTPVAVQGSTLKTYGKVIVR